MMPMMLLSALQRPGQTLCILTLLQSAEQGFQAEMIINEALDDINGP